MSAPTEKGLSALLDERRLSRPRRSSAARPTPPIPRFTSAPRAIPRLLGRRGQALDWFTPWQQGARVERALGEMVRRRQAERRLQLRRSPRALRAPQQGRHHLGRRAGRFARAHLRHARARGESLRQRAALARRRQGRPRGDLHGHGAGAGHRHARLRQDRRAAQHRLRRLLRRSAARAHQRRQSQGGGHLRRRLAPRHRRARSRPASTKPCAARPTIEKSGRRAARRRRRQKPPCSPAATSGGTS